MKTARVSLIKSMPPGQLEAAAEIWIVAPHWPNLRAEFGRLGLASEVPVVEPGEPSTTGDGRWASRVYRHREGLRLEVAVARSLLGSVCARRFGGNERQAATLGRASRLETAFLDRLASAVVADLPSRDWEQAEQPDDAVAAVSYHVHSPGNFPDGPAICLGLSGLPPQSSVRFSDKQDWAEQLSGIASTVRVPVRAILARPLLSAGEIARLDIGDVIAIRNNRQISLFAYKHWLAAGELGECDAHVAVTVCHAPGAAR